MNFSLFSLLTFVLLWAHFSLESFKKCLVRRRRRLLQVWEPNLLNFRTVSRMLWKSRKKKGRQTKRRQAKQCGRGAEPQTELPATPTFSHADALPVLPQVGSFTQTCVMKIIIAAVRSLFLPALPVVSGRPEFIAHFNPTGFQGGVPEGAWRTSDWRRARP